MMTYISDFGLPKDWSKKKKLNLTVAEFVPKNVTKTGVEKHEWTINLDTNRVFLTIDEALVNAIEQAMNLHKYTVEEIKEGVIGVLTLLYPTQIFNDFPVRMDVEGNPLDPEFDKKRLSFYVTLRNRTEEQSHMDLCVVDSFTVEEDPETGWKTPRDIKVHGIVNSAFVS